MYAASAVDVKGRGRIQTGTVGVACDEAKVICLGVMKKTFFGVILTAVIFGGAGWIQNAKTLYRPPEIANQKT